MFVLLLPVLTAIAAVFMVTGALLATLPLHVHGTLGYGADVVGIIAGAQFVAAVVSRVWAGRMADALGPRRVMLQGLVLVFAAGLGCLVSVELQSTPFAAVCVLLAGRALLGVGESFIITAGQSWCLALAGAENSAAVIGWAGTALYISLAVGGPVGGLLTDHYGFIGVVMLAVVAPVLSLPIIWRQTDARNAPGGSSTVEPIFMAILRPGFAAGFAGMVYAALAFFGALMFAERDWQPAWAPFTAFALALVLMRVAFGSLPDRLGARQTILIFLVVQVAGIAGILLAPNWSLAVFACFIAGMGYSFIYPALGRAAVRAVPREGIGRAVAYYSAFFDLSMALSGFLLGQLAKNFGLPLVFIAAIGASAVAFILMLTGPTESARQNQR